MRWIIDDPVNENNFDLLAYINTPVFSIMTKRLQLSDMLSVANLSVALSVLPFGLFILIYYNLTAVIEWLFTLKLPFVEIWCLVRVGRQSS